jgi:hypothetical protein
VNVLVDVAGPEKAVKPLAVPPREAARMPVQLTVIDVA